MVTTRLRAININRTLKGNIMEECTIHPYAQHRDTSSGRLWRAGRGIYGLCAAWNHATEPSRPMTDPEHSRANKYARAIRNRMNRLGFTLGREYWELSNGALFPNALR